jgi:hypothetical protein
LFALCGLWSSAWLVDGAWPSGLPAAARGALHDLVMAIVLGVAGWRRIARGKLRARRWMTLAAASVLLLGVPAVLSSRGGVSEANVVGLFAMVPVAVVVLVASLDSDGATASATGGLLAPALAGLGGALLLLPFAQPDSWRQVGLCAVVGLGVVVAAMASVWMHRLLPEFAVVEAAALCCLANAAFFGALFAASNAAAGAEGSGLWSWRALRVEAATAVGFDLPQILLLLWLLRDLAPERFAARYLVVPLLTAIEGYALLRPELTWRSIAGAALLGLGAWRLLTARAEAGPVPMLR